jgi:putative ABC transport system permease protein
MLKSYLAIAWRNLLKSKGYTILNTLVLTIGMTCCLLIFHYVSLERSYDTFQKHSANIVRIRLDGYKKGEFAWKSATSYPALAPAMKKDFPEIENFCRLRDAEALFATLDFSVKGKEEKGYFADPAAVDMFDLKTSGNPTTDLNAPYKMIVSESFSKKYFGGKDPVGQRLTMNYRSIRKDIFVVGVFREYPSNSHLVIKYLISYATYGAIMREFGDTTDAVETSFEWYDFYSYLQLKPGVDWKQLEKKLPAFADKYINNDEWRRANNVKNVLTLIPLQDIHLYSNFNQEAEINGSAQTVSFLFLIALLIISIAWVNYINLATARSVERAREVGVRKVLGALRQNLIWQFLIECLLVNLFALAVSAVLFISLIRGFDSFTGNETFSNTGLNSRYWLTFGVVFILGTLFSGTYPAFVLSSFNPVTVMKGGFKNKSGGLLIRKSLIVVQFLASVVMIAGTMIVYQQVNFMRKKQLGANINQTLVLQGSISMSDSLYREIYQPFKTELLQQKGVRSVTASSSVMGKEIYWTTNIAAILTGSQGQVLYHLGVDYDFVPSYQLKLIAGRNFSNDFPNDNKTVLLNEAASYLLGFENPQKAINSYVVRNDTLKIIGVVQNYHHQGLQKAIEPMIFLLRPNSQNYYSVKIQTGNLQQTISAVNRIWNRYFPAQPFDYFFLDDSFNHQYKAEILFGKVFGIFSLLAIIIASFGLLGLSAYNVSQRVKEISIRKILGASGQHIFRLLSIQFFRLILFAIMLAIPIGWFVMNKWLQDFAYRITISWWIFFIAGLFALIIALITISLQALKAITSSPVKNLRSE